MKIKRIYARSFFSVAALTLTTFVGPATAQTAHDINIQLGLFYPITTRGTGAPSATNAVSVNLIAGVSSEVTAFSFAGITNVVRNNASGVQFSGFSNHIGGRTEGLLFGGFLNTYQDGEGVQAAGFTNVARKGVTGVQFAGFANHAANVEGFQFAGFTNTAKELKGSQFAGFVNTSRSTSGSQFAGFINNAGDVKGTQIAGFINIAKKVKGTQIAGFINVADSSDNPVGIINIIKHGEQSLGVTTDDNATSLVSFRSGGRNLYGIIGVGYNFSRPQLDLYGLEAGLGAHWPIMNHFRINAELSTLASNNFNGLSVVKSSARLLPAISIGKTLELFGGPAFNYIHTNDRQAMRLRKNFIYQWTNRFDNFQGIYVGYIGGVQVLF